MTEPTRQVPRAHRYPLVAPVLYRRFGRRTWCEGVSVNMSRTGLLFAVGRNVIPRGERIEFRIRLPNLHGTRGCEVQCVGEVMRSMPGRYAGEPGAMGVQIEQYELGSLPAGSAYEAGARRGEQGFVSRRRQDD